MALITCPDCGHQVSDQAQACPNCARPIRGIVPIVVSSAQSIQQTAPRNSNTLRNVGCGCLGLMALVVFIAVVLSDGTTPSGSKTGAASGARWALDDSTSIPCSDGMDVLRETLAFIGKESGRLGGAKRSSILKQTCHQLPAHRKDDFRKLTDKVAAQISGCSGSEPVEMGPVLITGMTCASSTGALSMNQAYDERTGQTAVVAVSLDR